MGAVLYNLKHLQVAPKTVTPTYTDLLYAIDFDASISQDNEKLRADAAAVVTAYGAPEGAGSITFGYLDPVTLAILTGGTASTTGTAGTVIDRLEIMGDSNPPAIIVVMWAENVDGNADSAGIRITLPNAKASVPSGTYGQESFANQSADLTFDPDENGVLMILEFPVTAPVFTGDTIPTNLEPPA